MIMYINNNDNNVMKSLMSECKVLYSHPTQLTAIPQHLISLQQIVSHQLADLILPLPSSLNHLHLRLGGRFPFKVFI